MERSQEEREMWRTERSKGNDNFLGLEGSTSTKGKERRISG